MKKIAIFLFLLVTVTSVAKEQVKFAVVISANAEWKVVKKLFPQEQYLKSPWGEYFFKDFVGSGRGEELRFASFFIQKKSDLATAPPGRTYDGNHYSFEVMRSIHCGRSANNFFMISSVRCANNSKLP